MTVERKLQWRNWWRSWCDFQCGECFAQWRETGIYYECCDGPFATKAEAEADTTFRSKSDKPMEVGDFDGDFEYLGAWPENEVPSADVLSLEL